MRRPPEPPEPSGPFDPPEPSGPHDPSAEAPLDAPDEAEKVGVRPLYRDPNLLVIYCVTLAAVLSVSSLTPAFPAVARALDVPPGSIGLLISIFTLPGIVLTPVLGMLADRWGRKRILVPSLVLFGLAGGACGLARDFQLLLALRFLQGMGAASLGSLNVTLIGDLWEGRARAAAMGYNSSVLSVGTASYPAIGGVLATFAWHYPFLLPLVALPVAALVAAQLESPATGAHEAWGEYLRGVWARVRRPEALGLFAASTATFMLIFGPYLTFLPLLLDERFGASALVIGLVMSSVSLTTAFTATQLGRISRHVAPARLVTLGYAAYAVALVLIPLAAGGGSLLPLLAPALLFGATNGLAIPSIFTLLSGLTSERYRAAFMSVNGMVLRIGQTLGPLLAGWLAVLGGTGAAFQGGALLAAAMVAVCLRALPPGRGGRGNGRRAGP